MTISKPCSLLLALALLALPWGAAHAASALSLVSQIGDVDAEGAGLIKETKDALQGGRWGTDVNNPPPSGGSGGWSQPQGNYPGVELLGIREGGYVVGFFSGVLGEDSPVWKNALATEQACQPSYEKLNKNKEELGKQESKRNELASKLRVIDSDLEKLRERQASMKERQAGASRENAALIQKDINSIQDDIDKLEPEQKKLKKELGLVERKIGQAEANIKQAKETLKPLEQAASTAYNDLIDAQSKEWEKWFPKR